MSFLLSPIDGRYKKYTEELSKYFSHEALTEYRIELELAYYNKLNSESITVREIDHDAISAYEKQTHHEIKAIEYYIRDHIIAKEWHHLIHFGLTSEDIDSSAYTLCYKNSIEMVIIPYIKRMTKQQIESTGKLWFYISILGHTHGQAATPTSLGKEWLCVSERIMKQLKLIDSIPYTAKFGGATGNFNAHRLAYPNTNWVRFGCELLDSFGLERSEYTKQTDHRDNLANILYILAHICDILTEFTQDIWQYLSLGYLTIASEPGQIGSSTMPHKVNPIDFENAEGNFKIASNFLQFIGRNITTTRMQRDLSNSTIIRNGGVALGHMLLALKRLSIGLRKLSVNPENIQLDKNKHREVNLEAIQTMMRKYKIPDAYERCYNYFQNNVTIDDASLNSFIDTLDVIPEHERTKLKQYDLY